MADCLKRREFDTSTPLRAVASVEPETRFVCNFAERALGSELFEFNSEFVHVIPFAFGAFPHSDPQNDKVNFIYIFLLKKNETCYFLNHHDC